jgi:hypothetical protein
VATADEVLITVRTKGVKAAGADIDRTRKKLEGLGRAARGVGKDVRRATREIERLTTAASELSVADALGVAPRGRRSGGGGIEDARASLARMRTDVGKTNALLRQLDLRGPKRSPFAVPEIAGSARRLQEFNRTAQRTVGTMRAVRGASGSDGAAGARAGAGGASHTGAGRLDPPTGAPGRAISRDRPTTGDGREKGRGRTRGRAQVPSLAPLNKPSLSERPEAPTPREALRDLRQTLTKPVTKLTKPLTKGRDEKFYPAVGRSIQGVTDALGRGNPGEAWDALTYGVPEIYRSFKELSTLDKAVTVGAPAAGWAAKQGAKAAGKSIWKKLSGGVAKAGKFAWEHKATVGKFAAKRLTVPTAVAFGVNDALKLATGTSLTDLAAPAARSLASRFVPPGLSGTGRTPSPAPTLSPVRSLQPLGQPAPLRKLRPVSQPTLAPTSTPAVRSLQPVAQPTPAVRTQPREARPMSRHPDPAQRSPKKKWSPPAIPSYGGLKAFGRATGGTVRPGELTLVGEQGPEIARFPAGTQITPNRDTRVQAAGAASATRGRARDRVVRETPLNLSLDGQVFYRAVSRQTELAALRG